MLEIQSKIIDEKTKALNVNTTVDGKFSDILVELAAANAAVIARYAANNKDLQASAVNSIHNLTMEMFLTIKSQTELEPLGKKGKESKK